MKPEISIREYHENDKQDVVQLLRLNTPDYFSPDEEKDLIYYLDQEIEYYFVAVYAGKTVGCGGINISDDRKTGKISWDILHPDYQGFGIGSRLLQYRIAKMQEMQMQNIIVRTSQLAYGFYEKQGFRTTGIHKDYWAKGFDMYYMEYAAP